MATAFGLSYLTICVLITTSQAFSSLPILTRPFTHRLTLTLTSQTFFWMIFVWMLSMADNSIWPGPFCNQTFDNIVCWPDTKAGTMAEQNCPNYINNFDTRGTRLSVSRNLYCLHSRSSICCHRLSLDSALLLSLQYM